MMGIRPNRDGVIPPAQPDNPETRYSAWLDELDNSGEIVGEVWKDTDAKATSGNSGVADLAGRVAALAQRIEDLERVDTIAGTNWVAKRQGKVVFVDFGPVTEGWTFPEGWRPGETFQTSCFSIDDPNPEARIAISTAGQAVLYGFTGRAYGAFSFITT